MWSSRLDCSFFFVSVLAALVLTVAAGCSKEEAVTAGEVEVPAIRIARGSVSVPVEYVGQTKGAVDAEIRARVEGIVTGLHFQEGGMVKVKDLLYTIDPAEFLAKVAEAEAKVAGARTTLVKAESDLARMEPLAKMKAVSERDLDSAIALRGVAQGGVDAAMAGLDAAKIELSYTRIEAPVAGIIGLSKAKVGEFVGKHPNPVVLTTISQLDPIHVKFSIPEKDYLYFSRLRQQQQQTGEDPKARTLTLELSDGSIHPETGAVASIDAQIDSSTGTLMIEAAFPNPGLILRPGQFAKVRAVGETLENVIAVPKAAVQDIQGVKQVAVVLPANTVEVRTVKIEREVGDYLVVSEGLKEGELIVAASQRRLRTGTAVSPKVKE